MACDTAQLSVRRVWARREGVFKQYIATIYKTPSETQSKNTACPLGKLHRWILAKIIDPG